MCKRFFLLKVQFADGELKSVVVNDNYKYLQIFIFIHVPVESPCHITGLEMMHSLDENGFPVSYEKSVLAP